MANASPYLIESMVLLMVGASTLWLLPAQRKVLITSGVLALPAATLATLHVPAYWDPELTFDSPIHPEDVIWCLSIGLTVWFLAIAPFAHRTRVSIRPGRILGRFLAVSAVGGVLLVTTLRVLPRPEHIMYATVVTMLSMTALLALIRSDFIKVASCGAVGYTVFHAVDLLVGRALWPHTSAYWNPSAQLPLAFFDIPAFELVWAFAFGGLWPLMIAFVCDVEWDRADARRPSLAEP